MSTTPLSVEREAGPHILINWNIRVREDEA